MRRRRGGRGVQRAAGMPEAGQKGGQGLMQGSHGTLSGPISGGWTGPVHCCDCRMTFLRNVVCGRQGGRKVGGLGGRAGGGPCPARMGPNSSGWTSEPFRKELNALHTCMPSASPWPPRGVELERLQLEDPGVLQASAALRSRPTLHPGLFDPVSVPAAPATLGVRDAPPYFVQGSILHMQSSCMSYALLRRR